MSLAVKPTGKVPRLSVALCTFNGERHLGEQLASIAAQTLLPDELVVSDDGSTDGTAALVADFTRSVPFPVHWHRQPVNLGVARNFAAALTVCRGDCIALCDQDDVWLPNKLAAAAAHFARHPRCLALFTDATLTDENLRPLGPDPSLWRRVGVTPRDQRLLPDPARGLDCLAGRYLVTGATLTVRRELLARALPLPAGLPDKLIHDGWLALVAATFGGLDSLGQSTLLYRQHAGQQVGLRMDPAPRITRRGEYRRLGERAGTIHGLLAARPGAEEGRAALAALQRRAAFFLRRKQRRGMWEVACDLARGNYGRYCRHPLPAALRDLLP